MIKDALFYEKHENKVKCFLCPHNCVIDNGRSGICSVRTNKNGSLKTINYGKITSIAQDPIEKKPLYHFKPGSSVLSVGSFGCNFSCAYCQNYLIAHNKPESEDIYSDKLIDISLELENNIGIAFTYNEPSIWYEYVFEVAKKAKEKNSNINIVLVTNGYIEKEPLKNILPYIDAMNIDLKSFNDDYYKKICGGNLKSVLNTIETAYSKCHIEITTLLVNSLNDSAHEVKLLSSYIENIDKNIPLHLNRYFPNNKMTIHPTEIDVMISGRDIAKEHLNYVYLGNVLTVDNTTYCPKCKKILIERDGFYSKSHLKDSICSCGYDTKIIF